MIRQVYPELAAPVEAAMKDRCASCAGRWASAIWARMAALSRGRDITRLKGVLPDDLYNQLGGRP
jgi:hypothetical protein